MNKIKFASLIAYISLMAERTFTQDTITEIDNLITNGTNKQDVKFEPATREQIASICGNNVQFMMLSMRDSRKIDAIKACRDLTGLGLKEAKDMVEDVMRPKN